MAGLVPAPFDPIYAANKHAVVGLVRSIGDSYAAEGVRVHALCPSFAYTNIIKGSEQTLLDMGFPIIEVSDVVDAFDAPAELRDVGGLLVRHCGTGERAVPLPARPGAPPRLTDSPAGHRAARLPRRPEPPTTATIDAAVRRWVPPGSAHAPNRRIG